jgi:sugar lactone lactonase YvrE
MPLTSRPRKVTAVIQWVTRTTAECRGETASARREADSAVTTVAIIAHWNCSCGAAGRSDGVRTDVDGNVWCTLGSGDPNESGVRCYAPNGELIGKIHIPETCANLCFGGKKKNRLFMCGSTSIYALCRGRRRTGALKIMA